MGGGIGGIGGVGMIGGLGMGGAVGGLAAVPDAGVGSGAATKTSPAVNSGPPPGISVTISMAGAAAFAADTSRGGPLDAVTTTLAIPGGDAAVTLNVELGQVDPDALGRNGSIADSWDEVVAWMLLSLLIQKQSQGG